ncbi:hypothetical protein BGZ61DRAFT_465351 [Ilyonectria robusta]|uniref:uncharacterized protein n=1 Tax=Ilyonectria robusta TaxID=1079257 RepID=UPI001E8E4AA5|nr:uncharacterized protein BGZ61DRAFT_465351 [Ilyonectria robusta]KAH8659445.1 hypothetical protein BGZ61DRAFT_465351 [Ilyonectria robusta]
MKPLLPCLLVHCIDCREVSRDKGHFGPGTSFYLFSEVVKCDFSSPVSSFCS